jgi:hypothetical protein
MKALTLDQIVDEVHRNLVRVREQCILFYARVEKDAANGTDFTEILGLPKPLVEDCRLGFSVLYRPARTERKWTADERLMGECFRLAAVHDGRLIETGSPHELILCEEPRIRGFQRKAIAEALFNRVKRSDRGVKDLQLSWEWVKPQLNGQGGQAGEMTRTKESGSAAKIINIQNSTVIMADGNATINISQHIEYITNLRDAVAAQPENSPTFAKVAKKTALDIIGSAMKDVAKGQVKEAAKQIYELGKDLGPVIVQTAAYGFFKSYLGQ